MFIYLFIHLFTYLYLCLYSIHTAKKNKTQSSYFRHLGNPKGPCTKIVYTLALK